MDEDVDNLLPAPAEPIEKQLDKGQFIARVRRMKYCSDRCLAYDFCPAMPLAQSSKDERKPCVMKTMPEKVKRRFERLFLQGQDGLVKELNTAVYAVGLKTDMEGELSDHRAYAGLIMSTMKTLYGDKVEASNQKSTVTVNVISIEDHMEKERIKKLKQAELCGDVIDVEPVHTKTDEEMLKEYEEKWNE